MRLRNYLRSSLSKDETLIVELRLHWVAWLPSLGFLFMACVLLGISRYAALGHVIGLIAGGGLWLLAMYYAAACYFIEMGLTTERVVFKRGIIARHTREMRLSAVETVEPQQGVVGRILSYGRVHVTGQGVSAVILPTVREPVEAKRLIDSYLPDA